MAKRTPPLGLGEHEPMIAIERKSPNSKTPLVIAALVAAVGLGFGAGRVTAPAGARRPGGFGGGTPGQSFDPNASGAPGPGGGFMGGTGATSLDITITSVNGTTISGTTANGIAVTFTLGSGVAITKAGPGDATLLKAGATASVGVTRAALRTIFSGGGDLGPVTSVLVTP